MLLAAGAAAIMLGMLLLIVHGSTSTDLVESSPETGEKQQNASSSQPSSWKRGTVPFLYQIDRVIRQCGNLWAFHC